MNFQNTQQALEFGKNASFSQIQKLKKQHKVVSRVFDVLFASDKIELNFLMKVATKAQFIREAIEASQYHQ